MNILLGTIKLNTKKSMPWSLQYLKKYLIKSVDTSNICINILEGSREQSIDDLLHSILECSYDIIGLSCFVWNTPKLLELAAAIKNINKNIIIVLGGADVSWISEDILRQNKQIDIIVRGEGEAIFSELIKCFLSKKDIDKVEGITFRKGNEIKYNPNRELISNLDTIPFPYDAATDFNGKFVGYETQRGCIYNCGFCCEAVMGGYKVRYYSMDRVKRDLMFFFNLDKSKGVRHIDFSDATFNSDLARAKEICRFIIKHNKKAYISFYGELRAELLDDEFARLLKEASMSVEIGLQSANETTLRTTKRVWNRKKFENGIKTLKKHNVSFTVTLMTCLPGDTFDAFLDSLRYAIGLGGTLIITPLIVLPGTYFWNNAEKLGLKFDKSAWGNAYETKALSAQEVLEIIKIHASYTFLFKYKEENRMLFKNAGIDLVDGIIQWVNWLKENRRLILINKSKENLLEMEQEFQQFIAYFKEQHSCKIDSIVSRFTIFSV